MLLSFPFYMSYLQLSWLEKTPEKSSGEICRYRVDSFFLFILLNLYSTYITMINLHNGINLSLIKNTQIRRHIFEIVDIMMKGGARGQCLIYGTRQ